MAENEIKSINGRKLQDEKARQDIANISVPTKTSELTNDSNFITDTEVDTKISEAQLGTDDLSGLDNLLPNRKLIWHDEFDKPYLDETKWGHLVGGYKGDKKRYYMYEDVSKNVYCSDSILHITNLRDFPTSDIQFSGAFIHTCRKFDFKYGRVEAKIKYPNADAYHATLWTMSTNYIPEDMLVTTGIINNRKGSAKGENDISECDSRTVTHALHSTKTDSFGYDTLVKNGSDDWHIYACEWTPTSMEYFVDGVSKKIVDISPANPDDGSLNPFNKPHFLMLNMNPWMNNVTDQTLDFLDWQIDWVRVYAPEDQTSVKETSFELNAKEVTLEVNNTDYFELIPTFTPDLCNQTVKWESYNENIAIVKGGDILPVSEGTTYIKGTTLNGKVAFCKVTCGEFIPCTDLNVSPTSMTFTNNFSQSITLTRTPENTNQAISATCSPVGYAKLVGDKVIPLKNGECILTIKCGSATATISINSSGIDENKNNQEITWSFGTTNAQGSVISSTDSVVSSKINVEPSVKYRIDVNKNGTAATPIVITEYDSNRQFITRTLSSYEIITSSSTNYITIDLRGGFDSTNNIECIIIPKDNTIYNITNNLTNVKTSNTVTTIEQGQSYSAVLSAKSGYELSSVTVTMGGNDITNTVYSNGNITINNVTGNIVITATAISTGGSVETTYSSGYINDSGELVALDDSYVSNSYIDITDIFITNNKAKVITSSNISTNAYNALTTIRLAFYDTNKTFISRSYSPNSKETEITIPNNAVYVRFGATVTSGTSKETILDLLTHMEFAQQSSTDGGILSYQVGTTCDTSGVISSDSKKTLTDYIEIPNNLTNLYVETNTSKNGIGIIYNTFRCFDASKNCLGNPSPNNAYANCDRTIPTNTKYIRLILVNNNNDVYTDMTDDMVNNLVIKVGINAYNVTSHTLSNL